MNGITDKFSLRELLGIVFPGVYLIALLLPLVDNDNFFSIQNQTYEINLFLFILLSLIVGLLIYAIDAPKRIWFFKNSLPTNLIKKNDLKNVVNPVNEYFTFYDDHLSEKQKLITERYTSIYHFSVNIFLISIVQIVVYLIYDFNNFFKSYAIFSVIILILSLFLTLFIFFGNRKIKYMFERQFEAFLEKKEII